VVVVVVLTGCSYFVDVSTPHPPWTREPNCENRYFTALVDTAWSALLTTGVVVGFVDYSKAHEETKSVDLQASIVVTGADLVFIPAAVRGWVAVARCRRGQRTYAHDANPR
jgi:hypothetical protein